MKPFILFLGFILSISTDYSFGQCLTNGNFSGACTSTITLGGGTCPTWTNACGLGWVRSNGTPQMQPYSGSTPDGSYSSFYAYMYSYIGTTFFTGDTVGEGMFTPFTFSQNTWYDVKIDFVTYLNAGVTPLTLNGYGYLMCYAANGLTQHTLDYCEDAVPRGGGIAIQPIGSYSGLTPPPVVPGGVNSQSFTFQANTSFSQFWIYPYGTSTEQYNVNLYRVQICPSCTATANYPTGSLPITVAGATVTIGGGPSGTTAEPNPASNTTITASQAIYLKPGFEASAIGTGSTIAKIVPCGGTGTLVTSVDDFDSTSIVSADPPEPDTIAITRNAINGQVTGLTGTDSSAGGRLSVFPTVSSGAFTITGSPANLGNSNIIVLDQSGRILYRMYNTAATTIPIDLSSLSGGLYYIQIRQAGKMATLKIIISK
jgi:hypothetical protein